MPYKRTSPLRTKLVPGMKDRRERNMRDIREGMSEMIEDYFRHLAETKDADIACAKAGFLKRELIRLRNTKTDWKKREREILPDEDLDYPCQRYYLTKLKQYMGNDVRACRASGVPPKALSAWRQGDKAFKEKEDNIFAGFIADMNEQNIRLATGKDPNPKVDAQHLRWALPKVDKRWEDTSKKVTIEHKGDAEMKQIQAEIAELLGLTADAEG